MSGNSRKSKWQRAKNPEPIILQPRDKEIITKVYEFGFLTREQIQKLFNFHCIVRANVRLRKLFDRSYLSRRLLPTTRGSLKAIYFLGPRGAQIVAERCGVDTLEIKRRQQNLVQKKELFLDHDLLVNEVRISFCQAIDSHEGMKLDRWLTPIDCAQEVSFFNTKLNRHFRNIFRPDGYFRYSVNNRVFNCFLEIDMSSMSNSRFQSKTSLYLDYARSGLHQQRYGLKFFRVLVITKTSERLFNLKSSTKRITNKIFWFTTSDKLTPDKIFGQIWERPGRDGKFSLLGDVQ
jgi:hypothetical protein